MPQQLTAHLGLATPLRLYARPLARSCGGSSLTRILARELVEVTGGRLPGASVLVPDFPETLGLFE